MTRTQDRHRTIIELGRSLNDAQTTDTLTAGHGGKPEARTLQFSDLYHATCHPASICRNGNGRNGNGKPHHCTSPYKALQNALDAMKHLGKKAPDLRDREHAGHPLGVLRWNYLNRYVAATHKPYECHPKNTGLVYVDGGWQAVRTDQWAPLHDPPGSILINQTRHIVLERWNPQASTQRANLAVQWLDKHLPWNLRLPLELQPYRASFTPQAAA